MELNTNLVSRQEPIYKADIAKLAKALADPASVHSSKNQNGYVCLSGEKASWEMCARVAYNALKGRNHAKATSFVYQVGIEVIENTDRQIMGAILEMNSRLDDSWDGADYPLCGILNNKNVAYHSGAYLASAFFE